MKLKIPLVLVVLSLVLSLVPSCFGDEDEVNQDIPIPPPPSVGGSAFTICRTKTGRSYSLTFLAGLIPLAGFYVLYRKQRDKI